VRGAYRVVVWGPGVLGSAILRSLAGRTDVEVVGVLAYSDAKKGLDVPGHPGITMTTNKAEILDLAPDVVLFCPQATAGADLGSEATEDVLRLLRGGINVIAANGYHRPGGDLADALAAA
jgi:hypothetical protein